VASSGGLSRIDVADNDNVNVGLFFTHCVWKCGCVEGKKKM
jgi:hypothetical protein